MHTCELTSEVMFATFPGLCANGVEGLQEPVCPLSGACAASSCRIVQCWEVLIHVVVWATSAMDQMKSFSLHEYQFSVFVFPLLHFFLPNLMRPKLMSNLIDCILLFKWVDIGFSSCILVRCLSGWSAEGVKEDCHAIGGAISSLSYVYVVEGPKSTCLFEWCGSIECECERTSDGAAVVGMYVY